MGTVYGEPKYHVEDDLDQVPHSGQGVQVGEVGPGCCGVSGTFGWFSCTGKEEDTRGWPRTSLFKGPGMFNRHGCLLFCLCMCN